MLDLKGIRAEFDALNQEVHGKPLVYLDSAATSLKPRSVIETVVDVYRRDCANIHRAVHLLSQRATKRYENAREEIRSFIGAKHTEEIIFTSGTTGSINLVASSWGGANLEQDDEILLTGLEHHSNIVPWQLIAEKTGAKIVVVPVEDNGDVLVESFRTKISSRTKIVAVAHVSNALGTVLPVAKIAELAHQHGALVLVDGAQSTPHAAIDVQALGCDFFGFSGHKMYGPTGIGVLYGKRDLLEAMPPYQGGGDMILSVSFDETIYNELPYKFEAGTPNIAGAIGLGEAVRFLKKVGMNAVAEYEASLLRYATDQIASIDGVRIVGTAPHKAGVVSFVMDCAHPHDVGTIVDAEGVAIRTGHHCAQPVLDRFGLAATARASLGLYNNEDDIDALVRALNKVKEMFA
ncbi:MAG: cysteine desulfurase [Polyangiales bacterium]